MRHTLAVAGFVFLLFATGCNVVNLDPGPTKTVEQEIMCHSLSYAVQNISEYFCFKLRRFTENCKLT